MKTARINFKVFGLLLATGIFVLTMFVLFTPETNAVAGINRQINFQGKLVNANGTNVTDGSYTVVFTIYDRTTGGTTLWQESQSVSTTDGIFRVALGSVTPFASDFNFNWDGLYLGVKVGADSEMTPRIRLTAVPYAFNAERVSGLTVQDEAGLASTSGTLRVANGKTVTFGNTFSTGSNALTITTSGSTDISFGGSGSITLVDTTNSQVLTNKTIGSTGLTFSGATTDVTTATNEDFVLNPNGTGKIAFGHTSPVGYLDISKAVTGKALVMLNTTGDQALLTASVSGSSVFTVGNTGAITSAAYTNNGGILYTTTTGVLAQTAVGDNGECLQSVGGGTPTWGSCGGGSSQWTTTGSDIYYTTGNVGIGSSSPTVRLDVASPNPIASGNFAQLNLTDTTSMAAGVGGWMNFRGAYTGTTTTELGAIAGVKENGTDTNYSGQLRFYARTNGGGAWNSVNPQLVILGSSGNVGIGSTSPTSLLNVVQATTTGTAFSVYRNLTSGSTDNSVASIVQDHASDDQAALYLQNDGTSYGINLANNGTGLGLFINQAGTEEALSVYSNVGATVNQPLVALKADNVAFDQTLFRIQQDGTGHIFSAFDDSTEVFTIEDGGNVGIGTNDPQQLLDIRGVASVRGGTGWFDLSMDGTTGGVNIGNGSSNAVFALVVNSLNLFNTNSGNVGIGTTAPVGMLNITRPLSYGVTGKALAILDQTENQDIFTASASGTTRFVIENGGNVGIGTTTSLGRVTIAYTSANSSASNRALTLQNPASGTQTSLLFRADNSDKGQIHVDSSGHIYLSPGNDGDVILAYTSLGTPGNVGIGSTDPGTKLDVTGTGRFSSTLTASDGFTMTTGALSLTSTSGSVSSTGLTGLTLTLSSGTGAITAPTLNLNTTSTGNTAIGNGTGTVALTLGSDATGDTYYRSAGGVLARLPIGTGSECLKGGTTPSWGSCGSGTSQWTTTGSDIYYNTGNVGIGTTTSISYPLAVYANNTTYTSAIYNNNSSGYGSYIYTNSTSGSQAVLDLANGSGTVMTVRANGNVGIGTSTASYPIHFNKSMTNTSGFTAATYNYMAAAPASASTAYLIANWNIAENTTAQTLTTIYGLYNQAVKSNTSTLSNAYGSQNQVKLDSTGTITSAYALSAELQLTGAGTVGTYYGLFTGLDMSVNGTITQYNGVYVANPSHSSGTVTTNYGIHIANQQGGSTDYGLYIEGADTLALWVDSGYVRFDDDVAIGATTPTEKLELYDLRALMKFSRAGNYDYLFGIDDGTYSGLSDFIIYDESTTAMRFLVQATDGNVGINTTAPAGILDVRGGNTYLGADSTSNRLFLPNLTAAPSDSPANGAFAIGNVGTANASGRMWVRANGRWFRFNSVNAAGADFSEYIEQSEKTEIGDLVVIDEKNSKKVRKSKGKYEANIVGVVSEFGTRYNNGDCWDEVSCDRSTDPNWTNIGMLGQIDVKVTSENGTIKPGDPITSSSKPGVAMKATKAGQVVGRALASYDETDPQKVGKVFIYLSPSYFDPKTEDPIDSPQELAQLKLEASQTEDYSMRIQRVKDGKTLENASFDSYKLQNLSGGLIEKIGNFSQAIIANLQAGLIVGEDISSNTFTANNAVVKDLETVRTVTEILNTKILEVDTNSALTVSLGENGKFVVVNSTGEEVIAFDDKGNGYFAGELQAKSITAESISGLSFHIKNELATMKDLFATQSGDLKTSITASSSADVSLVTSSTVTNSSVLSASSTNNALNISSLSIDGLATISGTLRVTNNSLIEGILHVIDTIMTQNLIVNGLATFFSDTIFKGNVAFEGRPSYNNDTAGFAVIEKGQDRATITFENEYEYMPVVNASIVTKNLPESCIDTTSEELQKECDKQETANQQELLNSNLKYIISQRSSKGFTIVLDKVAEHDITFSWSAVSVKDVKTITSQKSPSSIQSENQFMSTQAASLQ